MRAVKLDNVTETGLWDGGTIVALSILASSRIEIKMRPTAAVLKRSAWKVPFVVPLPLKEAKAQNMPVRTKARACMIVPSFVGVTFQVHTGNAYKQFRVSEEMVGYKLGDFAPTKVRSIHKKK